MANVYYHYFSATDAEKQLANEEQLDAHDLLITEIKARVSDKLAEVEGDDFSETGEL